MASILLPFGAPRVFPGYAEASEALEALEALEAGDTAPPLAGLLLSTSTCRNYQPVPWPHCGYS